MAFSSRRGSLTSIDYFMVSWVVMNSRGSKGFYRGEQRQLNLKQLKDAKLVGDHVRNPYVGLVDECDIIKFRALF